MGYNGLIDPKSGFSPACCYSGPVQCPAGASVAYKFSITAATVYKGITGSYCRHCRLLIITIQMRARRAVRRARLRLFAVPLVPRRCYTRRSDLTARMPGEPAA